MICPGPHVHAAVRKARAWHTPALKKHVLGWSSGRRGAGFPAEQGRWGSKACRLLLTRPFPSSQPDSQPPPRPGRPGHRAGNERKPGPHVPSVSLRRPHCACPFCKAAGPSHQLALGSPTRPQGLAVGCALPPTLLSGAGPQRGQRWEVGTHVTPPSVTSPASHRGLWSLHLSPSLCPALARECSPTPLDYT